MKFGGPAGMQVFLDVLVFNAFTQLVGRLGEAALGATTLTVRLNMIAFLPMMGLGQAICILVGQRLGRKPAGTGGEERLHRPEMVVRLHVPGRVPVCDDPRCAGVDLRGGQGPGEVRRHRQDRAGADAVRGGLLDRRRDQPVVRLRVCAGRATRSTSRR